MASGKRQEDCRDNCQHEEPAVAPTIKASRTICRFVGNFQTNQNKDLFFQ